jgi:hypothetical protein
MGKWFNPAYVMFALLFVWSLLLITGIIPERANKLFVLCDSFVITVYVTLPVVIAAVMYRNTPTLFRLIASFVFVYMLTVVTASFDRFPALSVLLIVVAYYECYFLMPRLNRNKSG